MIVERQNNILMLVLIAMQVLSSVCLQNDPMACDGWISSICETSYRHGVEEPSKDIEEPLKYRIILFSYKNLP